MIDQLDRELIAILAPLSESEQEIVDHYEAAVRDYKYAVKLAGYQEEAKALQAMSASISKRFRDAYPGLVPYTTFEPKLGNDVTREIQRLVQEYSLPTVDKVVRYKKGTVTMGHILDSASQVLSQFIVEGLVEADTLFRQNAQRLSAETEGAPPEVTSQTALEPDHAGRIVQAEDGTKLLIRPDGTWEEIPKVSNDGETATFRSTTWGMYLVDVKGTEDQDPIEEKPDRLIYETEVLSLPAFVIFFFVENKLVRARYGFTPSHTNENDFIQYYSQIKDALKEKYGQPAKDTDAWRNRLYQDDPEQYRFAVSLGHLVYSAKWQTETTDIHLNLFGENYNLNLFIDYSSRALAALEEEAKKKMKKKIL